MCINNIVNQLCPIQNKSPGVNLSDVSNLNDTLNEVLKEQRALIDKNEASIQVQNESLSDLEKAMTDSFEAASKMTDKVGKLEEEVNKILKMLGEMQV